MPLKDMYLCTSHWIIEDYNLTVNFYIQFNIFKQLSKGIKILIILVGI